MTTETAPGIPGVLLAGGLARRMGGGDKPMRTIGGKTILERVIARLKPQCDGLVLNANGDPARFAAFGLSVIADDVADFPGPLAGILAALDWMAANRPEVKRVLSAAADCPFLPRDLVARLEAARVAENAELGLPDAVHLVRIDFDPDDGEPLIDAPLGGRRLKPRSDREDDVAILP